MAASIQIVTNLDQMIAAFAELERAPRFQDIGRLEKTLADAFEASQTIVHVLSGGLKASGVPHTNFDGSTWTGGIDYAREPGVYELALGDQPSVMHPEGQHGAFLNEAVEPYVAKIDHIVDEIFTEAMGPEK